MTTQGGERAEILIGLAAVAVTVAEMGHEEQQIVEAVRERMMQFGLVTAQDVRDVAHAIGDLPQPIDEPADVIERREPIRKALGVTSATDELVAAMTARSALEAFADRLETEPPDGK